MRFSAILLVLGACSESSGPARAPFGQAALIDQRVIQLASGELQEMTRRALTMVELDHFADARCIVKTESAGTVRFDVDGCTGAVSERRYRGSLEATNVPDGPLFAPVVASAPATLRFIGFRADHPDRPIALDGDIAFTIARPALDERFGTAFELAVEDKLATIELAGELSCANTSLIGTACEGELAGVVGGATFEAIVDTHRTSFGTTGTLRLISREILEVDFDATDDDGCTPYHIGARAGFEMCAIRIEELIGGVSQSCSTPTLEDAASTFHAAIDTLGGAVAATLELADPAHFEILSRSTEEIDLQLWQSTEIAVAADACTLGTLETRLVAYFPSGVVDCFSDGLDGLFARQPCR